MAKPEWGTKRLCQNCHARFYDMQKTPITCPACGTLFDPEAAYRSRRGRAAPEKARAISEETEIDEDDEDLVTEDEDEEAVLEDEDDDLVVVDDEDDDAAVLDVPSKKQPTPDDIDDDDDLPEVEDDEDDDTFAIDDEDEDEDVDGIVTPDEED